MPVELTHGIVVAHHKYRFVTPLESVAVHGYHAHEKVSSSWGLSPVVACLQSLRPSQLQSLSGNGMHLPTVQAVILFMASNILWKDQQAVPVGEVSLGRKGGTMFFENV